MNGLPRTAQTQREPARDVNELALAADQWARRRDGESSSTRRRVRTIARKIEDLRYGDRSTGNAYRFAGSHVSQPASQSLNIVSAS